MSAFPVCSKHGILKPCSHCEPTNGPPEKTCTDVYKGDDLERCECGRLRQAGKKHGWTRY